MMAGELTVEVRGLDKLQRKFNMSNKVVRRESSDAMEKAAALVHDRAGTYPAQPAASSYVRTGSLGRAFAHRVEAYGGGVKGYVSNSMPYASYVRGEDQAWMHAGRWATMKQIVEQKQGQIESFFRQAMQKLARFLGD